MGISHAQLCYNPTYYHLSTEMAIPASSFFATPTMKPLAYTIYLEHGIVGWFLSLKLCANLPNMTTNNSMKSGVRLNTCRSASVFWNPSSNIKHIVWCKQKQEIHSSISFLDFLRPFAFLGCHASWRSLACGIESIGSLRSFERFKETQWEHAIECHNATTIVYIIVYHLQGHLSTNILCS